MTREDVLYISDMDGTLLRGDATLSPASREKLKRMLGEGLRFTVATARSHHSALQILEGVPLNLPLIANNGLTLVAPDGRVIDRALLTPHESRLMIEAYLEAGLLPLAMVMEADGSQRVYHPPARDEYQRQYLAGRSSDSRLRETGDLYEVVEMPVVSINAKQTFAIMNPLCEKFRQAGIGCHFSEDIYTPGLWWLETGNAAGSKAARALQLKELTGAKRLVCFGDNLNDLSMMEAADVALTVDEGKAQVKALAKYVIGSHERDAVVRYMEKLWDEKESLS